MENQNTIDSNQSMMQKSLPNSTAVLVLGIISIVTCICYGVPGLICGIIALVLGGKSKKLYRENPTGYTESSNSNLKAGFICAIIGTCLSGLFFLYMVFIISFYGALLSSMPWESILDR